jgi:hypothetical protein
VIRDISGIKEIFFSRSARGFTLKNSFLPQIALICAEIPE